MSNKFNYSREDEMLLNAVDMVATGALATYLDWADMEEAEAVERTARILLTAVAIFSEQWEAETALYLLQKAGLWERVHGDADVN
jgi:hypothetical protein